MITGREASSGCIAASSHRSAKSRQQRALREDESNSTDSYNYEYIRDRLPSNASALRPAMAHRIEVP
jgi:hypothetical protein